jgi:hypothetical protein
VQDSEGRGPYKPGFSDKWADLDGHDFQTFMQEFPSIMSKINLRFSLLGGHFGCGFRTMKQLHTWFSGNELKKLEEYGYSIVGINPDDVLAESDKQLVFWCKKPLNKSTQSLIITKEMYA